MLTGGNMRKFIVIALLAGCGLLAGFPGLAQEPDAEFTRIVKEYRLNDDGSMEHRVIKELKILSHLAFHSLYGETFVIFDPRYQKLQINESYTIMADGEKVVTPANAFNEVLPRFATNFPGAAHLREMVITHTALEVGASIYLDYTILTAPDYYPALMGNEVLTTSSPVDDQIITVDIPESAELYHKMLHLRTAPEVFRENARKRFVWTFSNLKARTQEPFQPAESEYLPTLIFSTGRNFDEVFASFASQDAFLWKVNQEMKSRLANIKKEQSDPLLQVFAIHKLGLEEFNLLNVPMEYTGYRLRTAEETWLSNGGTEAEKNVLLCTLLKEAGFRAGLYAAFPNDLMDRSIGCLPAVKGFAVEVNLDDGDHLLLSATGMDDQALMTAVGDHSLVQIDPVASFLKINRTQGQPGTLKAEFNIKMDTAHRLSATISASLGKLLNPHMAIQRNKDYAKGAWTSFASAGSIKSCTEKQSDPEQSFLVWEADCQTALKKQDHYYFLELPVYQNGFAAFQMNYLNASRIAPLKIPFLLEESYDYILELPADLDLITDFKDTVIENPVGSVHLKIASKKRNVHLSRELRLAIQTIPPQHYEEFRMLINAWNDMNKRRLIFKMKE